VAETGLNFYYGAVWIGFKRSYPNGTSLEIRAYRPYYYIYLNFLNGNNTIDVTKLLKNYVGKMIKFIIQCIINPFFPSFPRFLS
jgi:hypothetical protein